MQIKEHVFVTCVGMPGTKGYKKQITSISDSFRKFEFQNEKFVFVLCKYSGFQRDQNQPF